METPAQKRARFVADACRGDSEARRELETLLARGEVGTDSLDRPFINSKDFWSPAQRQFQDGELIDGRFLIVRLLGSGGMGNVYEAEDRELGRIALKTIRPELAEKTAVLARFREEVLLARQIGGPNVCRIHELFCRAAQARREGGLHYHGASGWGNSRSQTRGRRLSSLEVRGQHRAAAVRGPDFDSPGARHSSRPEARQHHVGSSRRRGAGDGDGFWSRPRSFGPPCHGQHYRCPARSGHGHSGLHGARAVRGQRGGAADGHLRLRRGALRNANGKTAVCRVQHLWGGCPSGAAAQTSLFDTKRNPRRLGRRDRQVPSI